MGYTTDFTGQFEIEPALTDAQRDYLNQFSATWRMKRDASKTEQRDDPLREDVGLQIGIEGGYFVGEDGHAGQGHGADIREFNDPPTGQPSLWCQWVPTGDGKCLEWDQGEKFYHYIDWLRYIVENFLDPWGCTLEGIVEWVGEDPTDRGRIICTPAGDWTRITSQQGRVVYG